MKMSYEKIICPNCELDCNTDIKDVEVFVKVKCEHCGKEFLAQKHTMPSGKISFQSKCNQDNCSL